MCVSPSPYNGSETSFTVDFGERFSHLPANPLPPTLQDYEKLLKDTRKFIEENQTTQSHRGDARSSSANTMAQRKANTVAAKQVQLEFLESLDIEKERR